MKISLFGFIRNRFFNRLILLYSTAIVCVISVLILLILSSLSRMLREQSVEYNQEIIRTVSNFFASQCANFKSNQGSIYNHTEPWYDNTGGNTLLKLMDGTFSPSSVEYIDAYKLAHNYLAATAMPGSENISDALLINRDFTWNIQLNMFSAQDDTVYIYNLIQKYITGHPVASINDQRLRLLPAFPSNARNTGYSYAMYDYVRNEIGSGCYGYLVYTFDTNCIDQAYALYSKYVTGSILIITPGGNVIFDSSGQYYGKPFPYCSEVSDSIEGTAYGNGFVMNYIGNDSFSFITVGMMPNSAIYERTNVLTNQIILITVGSLICMIIFNIIITVLFSKRVRNIVRTIQAVQTGDFSARVPLGRRDDEIQLIARSLNTMSQRIDEYIKNEYVSELNRKNAEIKQKNAELYALQAQIDPHFLFNTLETIRMTVLDKDYYAANEMVKALARIFRSSINLEGIITIREELSNCRDYLELLGFRYEDRLHVSYDIDAAAMDYAIPKHVLQPILENSIIHGCNLKHSDNMINVACRIDGEYVEISIRDNGTGIPETKLIQIQQRLGASYSVTNDHLGIYNVNSRIRYIFGDDCGLRIDSCPGTGTEAVIRIHGRYREDMTGNV